MKRFAAFWLPAQPGVRVPGGSTEIASTVQGVARRCLWLQASRQSVKDPGFRCGRWSGSGIRRRLRFERVA
jgi:hypothetical protein